MKATKIQIRVTELEKHEIQRLAKINNTSMSEFILQILRAEIKRRQKE